MKIKDIPWYNRPGIRLKRKSVPVLSDAEILAIVLGRGNTTENAIDMSNRVLKTTILMDFRIYLLRSLKKNLKIRSQHLKCLLCLKYLEE